MIDCHVSEREREREEYEKKKLYLSHSLNKSQHNNITFDNNIHGSDDNRSHDVCASGEHTGYIDTNACGPKSPTWGRTTNLYTIIFFTSFYIVSGSGTNARWFEWKHAT